MAGWNDPNDIDEYLREEYRAERGAYAERRPAYARSGDADMEPPSSGTRLPLDYAWTEDPWGGDDLSMADRELLYRDESGFAGERDADMRPVARSRRDPDRRRGPEFGLHRPRRHEGGHRGDKLLGATERFYENLAHAVGADPDGGHRGRGPRNYQRSDERILDDVHHRLTDDADVDATEIEVTVRDREVTLSGTVADRFQKRRAEDVAESVSGVTHVQNNLRVQLAPGPRF
jgi:hypothetical protein